MTTRLMVDYTDTSGNETTMVVEIVLKRIPRVGEMLSFEQHPNDFGTLLLGVIGVTEAHYLKEEGDGYASRPVTEIEAVVSGIDDSVDTELLRETFKLHGGKILPHGGGDV